MSATPLTTECRAVAERMRDFPIREGSISFLQQLIYQDSATVSSLIPVIEALDPAPDQAIVQNLYKAAALCGSAGEVGGNIQTWPAFAIGADALIAACDAVEAAPQAEKAAT